MKLKMLCKNVELLVLTSLLMGCASQLTQLSEASTQEPSATDDSTTTFVSQQQEYMYKALVAEMAGQRGLYALSAQYFLEIAENTYDPRLAERAALIALYAKEYALAVKAAGLWIALTPNNPNARQLLGSILLRQESPEIAAIHLENMLNTVGENVEQRQEMVIAVLRQYDNKNNALKLMEQLAARRQTDTVVLLIYSRLLVADEQLGRATEVLQQLLKVAPYHEQGVLLYTQVLFQQKQTEQALQWIKQALDKRPQYDEWRLLYARILVNVEQYDKAIKQFQKLLAKNPNDNAVLYALGVLSLHNRQFQVAKSYFLTLLKNNEQADTARYYLGQVAEMEKVAEDALSWYQKVQTGPNFLSAQARIATILVAQGQLDKALAHLRTVPVDSNEERLALLGFQVELLAEQKRYDEAIELYNQALRNSPDNLDLLYMRAMLWERLDKVEQMESDLRHLLEINPKHVQALNGLGYTLADRTQRYQEAYDLIKQALVLEPDQHYILDSMGWVLYRLGQYQEAIEYLRKAYMKQADPEIAAHLGEVLWVSGDQEGAKTVWQKALQASPENPELHEVMARFLKVAP